MALGQGEAGTFDVMYRFKCFEKSQGLLKVEVGTAKIAFSFVRVVLIEYISAAAVE